jgi:pyridoxamine--pyruvate transaminase
MPLPDFNLATGPVMQSGAVLAALSTPQGYDYDPVYLDRYRGVVAKVAGLLRSEADVVIMQGETLLAIEAAIRGLCGPGVTALNLVSGSYADCMTPTIRDTGAEVIELAVPYDTVIDPAEVERVLAEHPEIGVVNVVHCETLCGTVNPVREIGLVARAHGALTISDSASAWGADELLPDAWGLDICILAAQKCISSTPGVAPVSVSDRAWAAMEANPQAPRGSYLSLLDWKHRWIDTGGAGFPHMTTMADIAALDAACDEVAQRGGLDAWIATHARAGRAVRAGIRAAGLELWARSEEFAADAVTAVRVPDGIDADELLTLVRERYGVSLAPSRGAPIGGRAVKLGHMGVTARGMYPMVGLLALVGALGDLGAAVDAGAAAAAALEVIGRPEPAALPR